MSHYDRHGAAAESLSQLGGRPGAAGYDHQRPAPTGWRAERQAAEMREVERADGRAAGEPGVIAKLLSEFAAVFRSARRVK